jgi:NADPH-dependent ferric siderophore reductase
MRRVTVGGSSLADFGYLGYDHWFRLFTRLPQQERFDLPELPGDRWWPTYLAIPEERRPHYANYTVADFRPDQGELDIDFVIHRGPDGALEGVEVDWVIRDDPGAVPGQAALARLRTLTLLDPRGYAFVVGESSLATEGRRHLHRHGMPKSRITFSGFWKYEGEGKPRALVSRREPAPCS